MVAAFWIIQIRLVILASCKGGVPSTSYICGLFADLNNEFCNRCLSKAKDLDNKDTMIPRTQEHTEAAMKAYGLRVLWKKYGMLSDIVVS